MEEKGEVDVISLPRSLSGIYTSQCGEGTCYAHAISKVFSRLIKVIFSSLFIKEVEICDELYKTKYNESIYNDEDIWKRCGDEILASLLFSFFLIYQ
jgi:ArsR family metal-binding transcriptional regulator